MYQIKRLRDGKSFVTRVVHATQRGKTTLFCLCSFVRTDDTSISLEHQVSSLVSLVAAFFVCGHMRTGSNMEKKRQRRTHKFLPVKDARRCIGRKLTKVGSFLSRHQIQGIHALTQRETERQRDLEPQE